jgi:hypothetical protein
MGFQPMQATDVFRPTHQSMLPSLPLAASQDAAFYGTAEEGIRAAYRCRSRFRIGNSIDAASGELGCWSWHGILGLQFVSMGWKPMSRTR